MPEKRSSVKRCVEPTLKAPFTLAIMQRCGSLPRRAAGAGAVSGNGGAATREAHAAALTESATRSELRPTRPLRQAAAAPRRRRPARRAPRVLAGRVSLASALARARGTDRAASRATRVRSPRGKSVYDVLYRSSNERDRVDDDPPDLAVRHEVGCWSHARTKLWEAAVATQDPVAREGLARIMRVFQLDRLWKDCSPDERNALRARHLRPHVVAFFTFADAEYERVKHQRGRCSAYAVSLRLRPSMSGRPYGWQLGLCS
jgi:Transposase IS66 family